MLKYSGYVGATLFLVAYTLNSWNILSINDIVFHLLNLFGAIFLGIRVYMDRNYAGLILEICFFLIAIYHIWRLI